jgi:site-specific DNA-methyltransferase (adenine-specific)
MKPYYKDDLVTIYHGDCREWMPEADVIVTDPPYGIALDTDRRKTFGEWQSHRVWEPVVGDDQTFDPAHLLAYGRCILWGANNYAQALEPGGWLIWRKTNAPPLGSECEMAWTNATRRIFMYATNRPSTSSLEIYHPTQKPVDLMRWCLDGWTKATDIVLDPYMGSGSTLVAAKSLGRKSIGIEIEERYCEVAAQRCSQEVLGLVG